MTAGGSISYAPGCGLAGSRGEAIKEADPDGQADFYSRNVILAARIAAQAHNPSAASQDPGGSCTSINLESQAMMEM